MKYIQVGTRKAKVSEEDFDSVSHYRWHSFCVGNSCYARSRIEGRNVYMHRFLMSPPADLQIDHINGNGLDNRRENLRFCTRSQNLSNTGKTMHGRNRYKGVYPKWNKWYVRLQFNRKLHMLYGFDTAREAAKARDELAKNLLGEFAWLNPSSR